VVAPAGAPPAKEDVRVFLTNGSQGINLTKGVWHHYQLSLEKESGYLVIDRAGKGNCEDMTLSEPLLLQF
jgi:ureidoglycolate lyase